MKIIHVIGVLLLFCCFSLPLQAQFLKKLGDKIERKVEQRIDRKTDQAIDKSLDKAEEGTEKVVKDATAPSEKSSGENRQPVEPKKAAPLPENYQLAVTGSGPDMYLAYRMTVSAQESSEYDVDMRMKMYASPGSGMGRSEVIMNMPVVGEMNMVMLTNAKEPLHIVVLNERRKQYSILDLSEVEDNESSETFTITKLGEENMHGLNCVHSRAVNQDGDAFELWTTKDIPGYEKMMALYSKSQRMGSGDLWKKLQEVDGAGFLVKMQVETKDGAYAMELTEIDKTKVPESLFQVPSDYEKKEGGWVKRFMQMGK